MGEQQECRERRGDRLLVDLSPVWGLAPLRVAGVYLRTPCFHSHWDREGRDAVVQDVSSQIRRAETVLCAMAEFYKRFRSDVRALGSGAEWGGREEGGRVNRLVVLVIEYA
ncbi:hypothetical protein SKAU_G00345580 [Synaphobranchus kaupii]|uniref:Uncharacterized protein n=1 Tax=Synaphobranchus kaupii TaxID=118154 RepID=A0A9Q1EJL1_SYNKA|nr:hypothetical protein SKAU_G00345580 [Synaphobranchus kaupii]